jgi:hypothetical protein
MQGSAMTYGIRTSLYRQLLQYLASGQTIVL